MKSIMQFLIGVSFVAISACGGSGGGGGDDAVVPINNDNLCGTVVDIGPNSINGGVLEAGDCRATDIDPTSGDTSFIDEYRITVNSMAILTINMRSASIDSFLFLMNSSTSCTSGCTPTDIITFDDDSGGGVNGFDALVSMDLAAGTYIILANSALPVPETGSYTLETSFRNPIGPYVIGQIGPAGGIVFYITNGGLNGLEAAPVDQSAGDTWGCAGTSITGADGTAVGSGAQNTADILAGCLDTPIAAGIADGYTLNGFSDWFLPAKDELNLMYSNIGSGNVLLGNVGGFASQFYWSSTEIDANFAGDVFFDNGSDTSHVKNIPVRVRAVRAF